MTTIKDSIATIVSTLPQSPEFLYGRKTEINYKADNANQVFVALIEPDDIGFIINTTTGNLYHTDVCFIQFVCLLAEGAGIANDATTREQNINLMRKLAAEFVVKVAASETLRIGSSDGTINVKGIAVIDTYDANVSGIEIQLPITNLYPETICI